MKAYRAKSGKEQFMPSIEELHEMDENMEGFCLACGNTQQAEPDAVRRECETCGATKVFGASELILMGLYY